MRETMLKSMLDRVEKIQVYRPGSTHVVGDGFHVRNLLPSNDLDREFSPFVMLDYAGPTDYPPTDQPRGVGEHPHRGFETVTILYQGIIAHRDSAGNAGTIGPGDVQWMTAASGVVHEEMHEAEWARRGGTLQAIQLWVNLPKAYKMSPPRYQTLLKGEIPSLPLANGAGSVRVIAGEWNGVRGPAKTFTPVGLYDLRLQASGETVLRIPEGQHVGVFVLSGRVRVGGAADVGEAELGVLTSSGRHMPIAAAEDAVVLVMAGEPIREPVARYGPFIMNTRQELLQAVQDYQAGSMGHLDG